MKLKMIVGFRRDQEHSIEMEEAHKAYYLFLHPESRGIFKSGLAIRGSDIQEIVPDWQGSMGWNPTHVLDSDDWNEIRNKGLDSSLRNTMSKAKDLAYQVTPQQLNQPLSVLLQESDKQLFLK